MASVQHEVPRRHHYEQAYRGEFDFKFNCDYSDCVSRDYHIPFLMLGTSNFCFCHADSVLLAKVHLMLYLNDNT